MMAMSGRPVEFGGEGAQAASRARRQPGAPHLKSVHGGVFADRQAGMAVSFCAQARHRSAGLNAGHAAPAGAQKDRIKACRPCRPIGKNIAERGSGRARLAENLNLTVKTMTKIRAGIIGCGKFAEIQHFPNIAASQSVALWHCSSRSEKGRKVAQRFGARKITADYRDILRDPEVDMVILAVPHEMHMFFIREVLSAGKHLLCEKPMTMTMAEAYEVIRLVKEKGVKLCVDYNRRFSPAMLDLKATYHAHRANPRGKARVYTQELNRPKWAEEDQTMILVRINDEGLTYGGVHIDWKEGGGQIIGEGCHWLDLVTWLMEERPIRVTAVGSTRINYVINLEFVSGSLACIFFSACGTFEYPKELFEIQHRGKIFRSECFVENQYFGLGERTVKRFPLQGDSQPLDHARGQEGGHSGYLAKIDAMGKEYAETGVFKYVFPDKGHRALLEAFADAILHDKPSPIDEVAGMRATYLSNRAMDSIRQGIPLPVNIEDWAMYVHVK